MGILPSSTHKEAAPNPRRFIEDVLAAETAPPHPFVLVDRQNLDYVARNYLAMSQAFPYLQAGSALAPALKAIETNTEIPAGVASTSVVGAFLTWDEFGGHYKMLTGGSSALPDILDTTAFHASLLANDLDRLLGRHVVADFTPTTSAYLHNLLNGLSHTDPVERCAWMVSFEAHAELMIKSLWTSVADCTGLDPESLTYFVAHVGGDDPAEAYHVAMTRRLVEETVAVDEHERFLDAVVRAYREHIRWCQSLVDQR